MIGQSQVTEPLMTALRTNRVNHAYLFSGPRGCGKTTSARILARCLNCAEGPTDTPCGKCESCVELGRGGQGSLDVVEIDAASHNGVDDARDIRERAIFAPARDRYKIFILDEAHMVTPQGFNALLKIVEEPPEHVKFIFATTEPDKVIGTIRSRTHHYPFRLVPPAQMLDYVQQLSESEGMKVAPGVLPLVVRAGGGSPRDTLSLLDQLIAGSEGDSIEYERAVALLGYTHAALLDEAVDAIGAHDAASAFAAIDRVIQTGQDPRRFVEDLLERLRDLIIVAATSPDAAAAVLRGTPQEELDHMSVQASAFGSAELSRCADIVNAALTEMTGATSPRLHLELMLARMLVPASDATDRGALARVERLERRVGVDGGVITSAPAAPTASQATEPTSAKTAESKASESKTAEPKAPAPVASGGETSAATSKAVDEAAAFAAAAASKKASAQQAGGSSAPADVASAASAAWATPGVTDETAVTAVAPVGPVTTQQIRDAWPEILEAVSEASRNAWAVVYTGTVRSLDGDVLALSFPSENDVQSFRGTPGAADAASEVLRGAIVELLGIRVKFMAKPAGGAAGGPSDGQPDAGGSGPGGGAGGSGGSDGSGGTGTSGSPAGEAPVNDMRASTPRAADASPVGASASGQPVGGRQAQSDARAAASRAKGGATSTASWATVAIPGGTATAVLDRPETPPSETTAERPSSTTPSQFAPGPTDADAPDDDEPPYPDDQTAEPAASSAPAAFSTAAAAASESPARKQDAPTRPKTSVGFREPARYGEAVVRELLGATFIEEQQVTPPPGQNQSGWSR